MKIFTVCQINADDQLQLCDVEHFSVWKAISSQYFQLHNATAITHRCAERIHRIKQIT